MNHADHVNLLRPAGLAPGGTWADLGAGSGAFTLALRELIGPEAEIYAVDKDRGRLDELEQAYRARFGDPARLHLLPADFTRPLAGSTALSAGLPPLDGIVMANSLHFFRDKETVLRHVRTFLKPGGSLVPPRGDALLLPPRGDALLLPPRGDALLLLPPRGDALLLPPRGDALLLLVEYNVDRGNPWVPRPLSFETFRALAPRAGFSEPRLLAKHPSRFLREFYSALATG
jgi:ubiquinone/menaquinone biosynthesis C-methylase UbiE